MEPEQAAVPTMNRVDVELHQYLSSIRERWLSGLLVAVLVLVVVMGITALQTPRFEATNRIFVQARAGDGVVDLNGGVSFASQQISSYADLATTPYVLDPVIEELGLAVTPVRLAEDITVTVPAETLILEITASSEDPDEAAAIANSTAENLEDRVATLASEGVRASIELRVVSPALAPDSPASPNVARNASLGAVLALLAGVGTSLGRSLLSTRVRGVDGVPSGPGRTVIATIPTIRGARDAARVLVESPRSAAAESYRELRTNLQFMKFVDDKRSVLLTSSLQGEGKSTCSVNLAYAMSSSGSRVLLIDADLRCPSLHTILGLEGSAGLSTVLIGQAELRDVVQPVGMERLDVLTSGTVPPNPNELLGSSAMEELLEEATMRYDIVIIDAAPMLPVTDAAVLSQFVGGVVVVAESERVRRAEIDRSMGKLEAVGAKVVGVVLNRVRGSASAQDAYGDAYLSAERDSAVPPAADVEPVLSGSAGANGPAQGDLPQRVLVRTPAPGSRDGLEGTMARPRGGAVE